MSKHFNSALSQSLGNLTTWKQEQFGLSGETTNGKFRLQVYNDHTVRVQITRHDEFEDFSYAVIASPEVSQLSLFWINPTTLFKNSEPRLTITKYPVRFSFYTHHDQLINEDDAFGTSWNGEQVTTYKKLQDGERFIGLGEKTGPWTEEAGYENWNTDNFAYLQMLIRSIAPFLFTSVFITTSPMEYSSTTPINRFSISVHRTIGSQVSLRTQVK